MSVTVLLVPDEDSGLEGGRPLDDVHAMAAIGTDVREVAAQAVRIGHAQARRRRVAIFNVLGEATVLDTLTPDDDPHGISDAVRYGVSLQRIAHQVTKAPNLFIVPGGAESPLDEEILSSALWQTWTSQFRDSGALMLVVAPAGDARVVPLLESLDGIVAVGEAPVPVSSQLLIGRVAPSPPPRERPPRERPPRPAPPSSRRAAASSPPRSRWRLVVGIAALLPLLGAAAWLGWTFLVKSEPAPATDALQPIAVPSADPLVFPAAADAVDSTWLAAWAVEMGSVNSATGALMRVRQAVDYVPVPTYSPVQLGEAAALWYRLLAGAFVAQGSADSLLLVLRERGVIPAGTGRVVRAPWAWVLEEGLSPELVDDKLFLWRQLGLPAYGLQSAQGLVSIYAGAFETDAEARLFAPVLDSLDIHATLRMRVGSIR